VTQIPARESDESAQEAEGCVSSDRGRRTSRQREFLTNESGQISSYFLAQGQAGVTCPGDGVSARARGALR
jgi:hypothetical protein